jgi:type II secretory pathway component PulJ
MPNENAIWYIYSNYKGPREITYEYQNPQYQRLNDTINRRQQEFQNDADLFWNPSKRPANYRFPNEHLIFLYDKNYNGPREITYEYQTPHIRRQHANFVRRKQYLTN